MLQRQPLGEADKAQPAVALTSEIIDSLALEVEQLRQQLLVSERALAPMLAQVHPENLPSARNLAHYLALRRYDVRELQLRLARAGLSSLGRSESHVLVTLDRILAILTLARGMSPRESEAPPVGFRHGERLLSDNAEQLLGPAPSHRNVRIIVTLPRAAATDPQVVADLIDAGMDCARINCARDDATVWSAMADNLRAARDASGRPCRILVDLGGRKLRTGRLPDGGEFFRVKTGDRFDLIAPGHATSGAAGVPRIECAAPEIFEQVRAGHSIWFDDGRLGGIIEDRTADGLRIRVTNARSKGRKLRPDRGINLPDTDLDLPALSEKDLADLEQVVGWADVIELSFAQRQEDVLALHAALEQHKAADVGVILKIETRRGFENLPQLLLAAMRSRRCGVMIARGDLAVESGFERMAEVQEEILWIAEAAHLPTIWATQVLENLAKEGTLSRAEVTDAAMSGRAEAVLLNKGPFIGDAIRSLNDILARMQQHQSKKRSLFRALRVGSKLWESNSL